MRRWIRRSLIALLGAGALFGGLAAWAQHRHHGWGAMSDSERAEMHARMVERIGRRLTLDEPQKARLQVLAQRLDAQHRALRGSGEPRAELQSLLAGSSFDRAKAAQMLQERIAAVQAQGPEVVSAAADFFDALRPEQQQQVRDFLQRGHRHGARG